MSDKHNLQPSNPSWRVFQWAKQQPDRKDWQMSKEFRRWVTAFPIEHGNTQLCWPLALV